MEYHPETTGAAEFGVRAAIRRGWVGTVLPVRWMGHRWRRRRKVFVYQ